MPKSKNYRKGKRRSRKDVRDASAKRTEELRRAHRVAKWEQLQRQICSGRPGVAPDLLKAIASLSNEDTTNVKGKD